MKQVLKNECKRAFFNKGMLLGLGVGIGIALWHAWQYMLAPDVESVNAFCMESVFYNWIGASSYPIQSYLYYFILPLLAVLPAGTSLYQDLHTGYIRQVYTRISRKDYFIAKYISVFLSGGFVVTVPLLLNFYMAMVRFPLLKPEPIMDYGPDRTSFGFEFYYSHPVVHTVIFLIITFLFAGGFAGIACLTSYYTEYKIVVWFTPFVCYYFLFVLQALIKNDKIMIAPNYFLIPGFSLNTIWDYIGGIVLFLIVAIWCYRKGSVYER